MSSTDPQGNAYAGNPYQPLIPSSVTSSSHSFQNVERVEALRSLANWQTFFAVLGFLATGLMLLLAIMQVLFLAIGRAPLLSGLFVGVYVGIAFFCYLIPAYLVFWAAQTARAAANSDLDGLAPFIQAQRSFWRYCGILGIIVVVLCFAFFVLLLLFGLTGVRLAGVSMP